MDETSYKASDERNSISVLFDLRSEENCFIELQFSEDDALSIINMKHLGKSNIPIGSIGGTASLGSGKSAERSICLSYRNGNRGTGTVSYPYEKLSALLNEALTELSGR